MSASGGVQRGDQGDDQPRAELERLYLQARAAVLYGMKGTCSLDADGVDKDEALEYAAEFLTALEASGWPTPSVAPLDPLRDPLNIRILRDLADNLDWARKSGSTAGLYTVAESTARELRALCPTEEVRDDHM